MHGVMYVREKYYFERVVQQRQLKISFQKQEKTVFEMGSTAIPFIGIPIPGGSV